MKKKTDSLQADSKSWKKINVLDCLYSVNVGTFSTYPAYQITIIDIKWQYNLFTSIFLRLKFSSSCQCQDIHTISQKFLQNHILSWFWVMVATAGQVDNWCNNMNFVSLSATISKQNTPSTYLILINLPT